MHLAGHAGVADLAEGLPLGHIADVHLGGGQVHGLQRVQNGNAGVGVGAGVDDDAVVEAQGALDGVHQAALVVGLVELGLYADGGAAFLYKVDHALIVHGAVDARLPHTQHVQVRSVQNQEFHKKPPQRR